MNDASERLKMRYIGLKVFKDDEGLLDEVFYNGSEIYFPGTDEEKRMHFYTDRVTKSTFCLEGRPSSIDMRKKLEKIRTKFYEGGN